MAKLLVYIPEDMHAALRERKERTGCTTSALTRTMLRKVLIAQGYLPSSAEPAKAGSPADAN